MLSVVMAVHNGSRTLPLTLGTFEGLHLPDTGVEFIVVDNASTDDTAAILQSFQNTIPLRLLHEPVPGRSRALNRGVAVAQGDLVIFTDDDVLPDSQWLLAFRDAARTHPDVDIFGGQVRHYWQKTPPRWLKRLAAEGLSYGGTPEDQPAGPADPKDVKGANLAVRRRVFDSITLREDVGYGASGEMIAGDETDFVRRAREAGHKAWFIPEARLRHIVRPHEVALKPVLRRYFRIGRGMAAINPASHPKNPHRLFGYPRHLYRAIPTRTLKAIMQLLKLDTYKFAKGLIHISMMVGHAYQVKAMGNEGRKLKT